MWSVRFGVWRKQWEVRSVKCEVRSVKCGVWSFKFGVRRVQCEVWSVKTLLRLSLKKSNGCRGKDTVGTGRLWTIGHLCLGNFRRRLARVYVNLIDVMRSPLVGWKNRLSVTIRWCLVLWKMSYSLVGFLESDSNGAFCLEWMGHMPSDGAGWEPPVSSCGSSSSMPRQCWHNED